MQGLPKNQRPNFGDCKRTAHFWKLETNPVAQPMRSIVAAYEHPLGYEAKARSSAWKWWVYSTIHVELRQLRQFTPVPFCETTKVAGIYGCSSPELSYWCRFWLIQISTLAPCSHPGTASGLRWGWVGWGGARWGINVHARVHASSTLISHLVILDDTSVFQGSTQNISKGGWFERVKSSRFI